ncbi:DUF6444 domain-containing protein [Myxococcus sp. AM010]|uniref:DUF6444 domain-containing protein n=1 Tax=Myxococcus sp. AM010 TaxID=2745138 RepID=UPI00159508C1|nr:hypothetical protein [Myxococcus sp. AM010]
MATLDPKDARIAELEQQLSEAHVRIEQLEARIVELEVRLRRTSRNSSSPPPRTRPVRRPGNRSQPAGGQPGHKGRKRELLPLERVSEVVEVPAPERCTGRA